MVPANHIYHDHQTTSKSLIFKAPKDTLLAKENIDLMVKGTTQSNIE